MPILLNPKLKIFNNNMPNSTPYIEKYHIEVVELKKTYRFYKGL